LAVRGWRFAVGGSPFAVGNSRLAVRRSRLAAAAVATAAVDRQHTARERTAGHPRRYELLEDGPQATDGQRVATTGSG
jgi:hypothetical protein